jgi:cation diffusion facilitator CzcD-associated flavoprotein CzcO
MINRQARGGGSVSPEYIAILDEMVKQNKLDIYEKTTVVKATFDQALKKWQIWFSNGKKESFDGIWLATGSEVNINKLPFLQTLLKTNPIEIVNNLPVLTNGND